MTQETNARRYLAFRAVSIAVNNGSDLLPEIDAVMDKYNEIPSGEELDSMMDEIADLMELPK